MSVLQYYSLTSIFYYINILHEYLVLLYSPYNNVNYITNGKRLQFQQDPQICESGSDLPCDHVLYVERKPPISVQLYRCG